MIQGTPKFDALAVGELSANFMGGPGAVELKTKIAFVNSKTGTTHGFANHHGPWSANTLAKLRELTTAMETDLAEHHLAEASQAFSVGKTGAVPTGGLGEHFSSDDDPPQV